MGKSCRVTLSDIAGELNLSVATVSRAINNGPHNRLSDQKKKAVFETAKRLGYQPNMAARALSMGRAPLLGIILPSLRIEHFSLIASGFEEVARAAGFQVVALQAGKDGSPTLIEAVRTLQTFNISGILMCPVDDDVQDAEIIDQIDRINVPIVLVDRPVHIPKTAQTVPDNRGGGWLGGKWLIDRQCDRVLCVTNNRQRVPSVWKARFRGVGDALKIAGIDMRECFLNDPDFDRIIGDLHWVCQGQQPGIFIHTFFELKKLCNVLDQARLFLPAKTHLCGFDRGIWTLDDRKIHSFLASLDTWPHAITYCGLDMGKKAAQQLITHVKTGEFSEKTIMMPVRDEL